MASQDSRAGGKGSWLLDVDENLNKFAMDALNVWSGSCDQQVVNYGFWYLVVLHYADTFDASISLHSHLVHSESYFFWFRNQDRLAPTGPDDLCWWKYCEQKLNHLILLGMRILDGSIISAVVERAAKWLNLVAAWLAYLQPSLTLCCKSKTIWVCECTPFYSSDPKRSYRSYRIELHQNPGYRSHHDPSWNIIILPHFMSSFPADLAGLRSKLCSTLSGALRNRVRMLEKCRCQMVSKWLDDDSGLTSGEFWGNIMFPTLSEGSCGKKLMQHFCPRFQNCFGSDRLWLVFPEPGALNTRCFCRSQPGSRRVRTRWPAMQVFVGCHGWKTSKVKVNVHNAHE